MDLKQVTKDLDSLLDEWQTDSHSRLYRTELDRDDFKQISETGFLLTGVPISEGGLWENLKRSNRSICDMIRCMAHCDPSVALVSCMPTAVLSFWLCRNEVPEPFNQDWQEQRSAIFETVKQGHWWGTITSEPGSGGDILKTKVLAKPTNTKHAFELTGDKHFGSGSGIMSYMVTTALPEGDELPDIFYLDTRDPKWDGSTGMKIIREWDGFGMMATQSHAFQFKNFPMTRIAWPENPFALAPASFVISVCTFTAVAVGIIEQALKEAKLILTPKKEKLRPYEQVEWAKVVNECWTIQQVYEGMLSTVESTETALVDVTRGKVVIAELAEKALIRMSRVIGGGSFSKSAPFGQWAQDVRALGFLRPPWGLAYDNLYNYSWES